MKTFTLRKNGIITHRTDMAMSNNAISGISSLKNSGKALARHHTRLEGCQKTILAYMKAVNAEKGKWEKLKASLTAGASKEEDFDISSIEARLADFKLLYNQLSLAERKVGLALSTSKALPHKCDEFTNIVAEFSK